MNEIDALKKFEVILVSAYFYMLNICWMLWNANKVQNTKQVFLKFMNVIVKIFKESRVRIGLLSNFKKNLHNERGVFKTLTIFFSTF